MLRRFDKLLNESEHSKTLSQLYQENNIDPDATAICLAMDGGVRWEIPRAYDSLSLEEAELKVATQEAKKIGKTIENKSSPTTTFIHHYELRPRRKLPTAQDGLQVRKDAFSNSAIIALDSKEIKGSMQSHRQKLGQPIFSIQEPQLSESQKEESLFKETPDEIIPNLFLGNGTCGNQHLVSVAQEEDKNGFVILRCTKHPLEQKIAQRKATLEKTNFLKVLAVGDLKDEHISQYFDECYDFIEEALKRKKKVLVHCDAGASRSPTIVAAYLIRKYGLTAKEAINHIKTKRPCVNTDNFTEQLEQYADIHKLDIVTTEIEGKTEAKSIVVIGDSTIDNKAWIGTGGILANRFNEWLGIARDDMRTRIQAQQSCCPPELSVVEHLQAVLPEYKVLDYTNDGFTTGDVLRGASRNKVFAGALTLSFPVEQFSPLRKAKEQITHADYIVLSIGGNNFREFLLNSQQRYDYSANRWITRTPAEKEKYIREEFPNVLQTMQNEYAQIVKHIRTQNPKAKIILTTQYYPSASSWYDYIYPFMKEVGRILNIGTNPNNPMDVIHAIMGETYTKVLESLPQDNIVVADVTSSLDPFDSDNHAMQIEPSGTGGKKMAKMLQYLITHDTTQGHAYRFLPEFFNPEIKNPHTRSVQSSVFAQWVRKHPHEFTGKACYNPSEAIALLKQNDPEFNGYHLSVMSDKERVRGKIYLGIEEEKGLRYEAIGIDGETKKGIILWSDLPPDFPKTLLSIVQFKGGLSIIVDEISKANSSSFMDSKSVIAINRQLSDNKNLQQALIILHQVSPELVTVKNLYKILNNPDMQTALVAAHCYWNSGRFGWFRTHGAHGREETTRFVRDMINMEVPNKENIKARMQEWIRTSNVNHSSRAFYAHRSGLFQPADSKDVKEFNYATAPTEQRRAELGRMLLK